MSKIHMLTLSIAESKPQSEQFEIICFYVTTRIESIVSFYRTKDQIFDKDGNALWDLCKYTIMDDAYPPAPDSKNPVYVPKGEVRLLTDKEISRETMKQILEQNKISYKKFMEDPTIKFAIVQARQVVYIDEDTGEKARRKQRMRLDFDDNNRAVTLLNKDYRWIHYWRQIPDEKIWDQQEKYRDMLNQPGKKLYLILRRYTFKNKKSMIWISGMHWL